MVGRRNSALATALVHGETPEKELLRLITGSSVRDPQGSGVYPIHLAARYTTSATVMRAILDACPDLLEAKTDLVRTPPCPATIVIPEPRPSHTMTL